MGSVEFTPPALRDLVQDSNPVTHIPVTKGYVFYRPIPDDKLIGVLLKLRFDNAWVWGRLRIFDHRILKSHPHKTHRFRPELMMDIKPGQTLFHKAPRIKTIALVPITDHTAWMEDEQPRLILTKGLRIR